jgi:DNA-directed RNA polymerase specialized sigma24 family protein
MQQTLQKKEMLFSLKELFRLETDEYLKELQLYCYKYALKLIKDPETAQDITQTAMQALFKELQQIEAIKGWLRSTVYNLAMTAIKLKGRDRELIRELTAQKLMYYDPQKLEKVELEKVLSEEQVKELLSKDDYSRFLELNKYNSLKEYAEKAGISYGTAKKHSHIIRRDLKAAYLRKMGWKAKPEILTYKQYDNLRRFVHRLLEYSNNNEMERLNRYCSKIDYHQVEDVLMQINQIDDW